MLAVATVLLILLGAPAFTFGAPVAERGLHARRLLGSCSRTATVKSGDSCWALWTGAGNDWSVAAFAAANPGVNCAALQVGQRVCLSSSGGATPSGPTPSAVGMDPACAVFGALCAACNADGCTSLLGGATPLPDSDDFAVVSLSDGSQAQVLSNTAGCDSPDPANPKACTQVRVSPRSVVVMSDGKGKLDESAFSSVFDESCSNGACFSGAQRDVSVWKSGDSQGSVHAPWCQFDYTWCGYLTAGSCTWSLEGHWVGDQAFSAEEKLQVLRRAWVGAMIGAYGSSNEFFGSDGYRTCTWWFPGNCEQSGVDVYSIPTELYISINVPVMLVGNSKWSYVPSASIHSKLNCAGHTSNTCSNAMSILSGIAGMFGSGISDATPFFGGAFGVISGLLGATNVACNGN